MATHATKPASGAGNGGNDDGVAFPIRMVVRNGRGLGKMSGRGRGRARATPSGAPRAAAPPQEGSLTELEGGRLFYAPQIGFTLEVKVEINGLQPKTVNLYVDSGSALTWLEDKLGTKLFADVGHLISIHYLDETAFRGVPKDNVKVTIAPSSPTPLVLDNRYIGLGHLYENVPMPADSRAGSPMQISPANSQQGSPSSGTKKLGGESGSTTPERAPGSPQPIKQTHEMGDGMIGFSPKAGSKRMLYNIQNGNETKFTENIKTLMSDLGTTIGTKRRVFFYLTPHGHESESRIMFGKPTAGTAVKMIDPDTQRNVDFVSWTPVAKEETGHWRLNAEVKIGATALPIDTRKSDAHLDNGYSRLALPRKAYLAYKKATGAHNKGGRLVVSKEDYAKLTPLTITFKQGQTLAVPFMFTRDAQLWPQDYNTRENVDDEFQFTDTDHILIVADAGEDFVIGSAPQRYFMWGFDDKDSKIFLGKTKYSNSTDVYNARASSSSASQQQPPAAASGSAGDRHTPPSDPEHGGAKKTKVQT